MAYCPLFCQSHHSPHGVNAVGELVRRARALGYSTLGLADEATMAGFEAFDAACAEGGIRPVFGCRIRLAGISLTGLSYPIDCVIQSEQGYRNLVRILSRHNARGRRERHPLDSSEIRNYTEGLFVVIPPDGELMALIARQERSRVEDFLAKAVGLFGSRLAIGLAPDGSVSPAVLQVAWELARFANLTPMAAHPVRYAEPGDDAAAVYLTYPHAPPGRAYRTPTDPKALPALWPESDILARWPEAMQGALQETGKLASVCSWRPASLRRAFPVLDMERGFDPNSYLFDLVIKGAKRRYGEIKEELKQRIQRELDDVKAHHLAPWMLLNYEVARLLDEMTISRGVGRGRLVASMLAYCLNITRLDPVAYNLNPRSLAVDGEVFPAVAVEIPRHAQARLIERLRKTYGEDRVAEIGRIRYQQRGPMIAEIAQWSGMTREETRLLQGEKKRLRSAGAAQRLTDMAEKNGARRWRDTALAGAMVARLAPRPKHWEGSERWVIAGEPLELAAPLIRTENEEIVTGLEERAIDRLGLARLGFVPHHLLDIYDRAMRLAADRRLPFDPKDVPLNDRATFELLGNGDTDGIPPLESIAVRCLLRKNRPSNLLQLLRIMGDARAQKGGPAEGARPVEIADQFPDVLMSYQCAFLKAHDPLGFHCAAIGMAIENRVSPLPFIRAVRRAGMEVAGPDLGLSDFAPTIQRNAIRIGLSAVANLGPRAWENINETRSGDPFNSFEHFCQSVDLKTVRRNILHALVGAGACDRFGPGRAAMDAAVDALARAARARARAEGDDAQASFFGEEAFDEGDYEDTVVAGDVVEWTPARRLQREAEALGFSFTMDLLDRSPGVKEHLAPLEVGDISARHTYQPIRVAGIICDVETRSALLEEGDAMLNLEGLAVLMPAPLPRLYAATLEAGAEVMVMGRITREPGYPMMIAEGVWRLSDLEAQARMVTILGLELKGENKQTLKTIEALVKAYPGESAISISGYDAPKSGACQKLLKKKIFFCSPLYQALCKVLGAECIALYGRGGGRLEVRAADDGEKDAAETPGDEGEDAAVGALE